MSCSLIGAEWVLITELMLKKGTVMDATTPTIVYKKFFKRNDFSSLEVGNCLDGVRQFLAHSPVCYEPKTLYYVKRYLDLLRNSQNVRQSGSEYGFVAVRYWCSVPGNKANIVVDTSLGMGICLELPEPISGRQ